MLSINLTFDEAYQMNKLYETMLDMDMIDECPQEIENVFDKIRDAQDSNATVTYGLEPGETLSFPVHDPKA